MSLKMSKIKLVLFYIGILLTTIVVMHDTGPMVIANNLYHEFKGKEGVVNYILSGPSIILIFSSMLAGVLLKKISQKKLLVIGCSTFTFVAFFSTAINNVYWLAFMRTISGFAVGFVNVAAVALIAEVFTDEKKRSSMMGMYNAASSILGAVISYVAGALATIKWQLAYAAYWPSLIMLIFCIIAVPETKKTTMDTQTNSVQEAKKSNGAYGIYFWMFIAAYFLYDVACIPFTYFSSVYCAENALGNESFTGLVNALFTLSGFFFAMGYGFVYGKLKRATGIPIVIATMVAGLLLFFWPSKAVAVLGYILMGGFYVLMYTFGYGVIPDLVPPEKVDGAISISTATYAAATLAGTYMTTFLMNIMKTDGRVTPIFIPCVTLLMIPLILELVGTVKFKSIKN